MLKDKLKKGLTMIGEYNNDDDSGLEDTEALEMEEHVDPDKLGINLKVHNIYSNIQSLSNSY